MLDKESLDLHKKLGGKLEIKVKQHLSSKRQLSLLYTPGVAGSVKAINQYKSMAYQLTLKKNTVAVVTDASAVLGLGKVSPEAALPVMEGKCLLFKELAGIDAFPLCLRTDGWQETAKVIRSLAPVFAAINLEDIAAPDCFKIEENLQDLGIPVVHDDQHATAIAVLAGLFNAIKLAGKNLKKCRIVVCGAGAAGNAVIKLLHYYGCQNLLVVDSNGIIGKYRQFQDVYKKELSEITNPDNKRGNLIQAVRRSDVLIGVSKKNLFTGEMIRSMNSQAIVFALANPDPEISREEALEAGAAVYASGSSTDRNQINNALVFPGLFRGMIDNRIRKITPQLKIKTAKAIASLVKKPSAKRFMPSVLNKKLVRKIAQTIT